MCVCVCVHIVFTRKLTLTKAKSTEGGPSGSVNSDSVSWMVLTALIFLLLQKLRGLHGLCVMWDLIMGLKVREVEEDRAIEPNRKVAIFNL